MFITKKEFERRVNERVNATMEEYDRDRHMRERMRELENRFENTSCSLWSEIEKISRKLDGGQKLHRACDEPKTFACERL